MAPDMVALERVSGTVFPTFKEVCMAPAWEAWGGLKRPGEALRGLGRVCLKAS